MKQGDKRSYIYKLKRKTEVTSDDLLQYYKAGNIDLGRVQIFWTGNFGEKNTFNTKSITSPYQQSAEAFSSKLFNAPTQLILEEPIILNLRITNMSANAYALRLYVNETETKTIAINALSHQVINYRQN